MIHWKLLVQLQRTQSARLSRREHLSPILTSPVVQLKLSEPFSQHFIFYPITICEHVTMPNARAMETETVQEGIELIAHQLEAMLHLTLLRRHVNCWKFCDFSKWHLHKVEDPEEAEAQAKEKKAALKPKGHRRRSCSCTGHGVYTSWPQAC